MTQNHSSLADLDLNLLRVLDALLVCGSVSEAARRLGMTQSGVSRALGRLRAVFGDELLVRQGRAMARTPRAEALAVPVARVLGDIERLLVGPGFDPAISRWQVVIGGPDYVEHVILPMMQELMLPAAPSMNLRMSTQETSAHDLYEGRLDILVAPREQFDASDLVASPLVSDTFCCLLRQGHPALDAGELSLEDFVALDHLLVAPGGKPGGVVDTHLARLGLARRVRVQLCSFTALIPLIRSSDAVVTLPQRIADRLAEHPRVVKVACPLELAGFDLVAFWASRRRNDPAHRWLRGLIHEVAGRLKLNLSEV